MTTTTDIAEQVRAIKADLKPLLEFRATLEAELKAAQAARPTPTTHNDAHRAKETLHQLQHGTRLGEGMDPRLWDLLNTPAIRRHRFYAPGIEPLERKRDQFLALQVAMANPAPAAPLLAYRYTGPHWGKVAGARRQTGDVIHLSAEEATQWTDKLEAV
jgi:hypothetical protein